MSKKQGEEVFDAYFSSVYSDRWTAIKNALHNEDLKIARKNQFFKNGIEDDPGIGEPHPFLEKCFAVTEAFDLGNYDSSLLPFYRMDPASVIAARELGVKPGESVLDMCAAPGGKSLILAEDLFNASSETLDLEGNFVANEMSARRRFRMMSVFKRYIPKEARSQINIKGVDGSVIGLRKKEAFDRILLDAPCSGERGVVQKKSDLATWKEKRSKSFGIRQYALLSSAFMSLKSGGNILYSTCSISPHENDEVIRKLKKRKEGEFEISPLKELGPSESTEFGRQFLPDKDGWGPIFYCKIQKL